MTQFTFTRRNQRVNLYFSFTLYFVRNQQSPLDLFRFCWERTQWPEVLSANLSKESLSRCTQKCMAFQLFKSSRRSSGNPLKWLEICYTSSIHISTHAIAEGAVKSTRLIVFVRLSRTYFTINFLYTNLHSYFHVYRATTITWLSFRKRLRRKSRPKRNANRKAVKLNYFLQLTCSKIRLKKIV